MLLDATTKTIEVKLGGAVVANQCPITAFYVDHTTTGGTPGESDTQTNGDTAVTTIAAPASLTQRQVKMLTVYNADTAAITVTVQLNNNSTLRIIGKWTLAVGETLIYQNEMGFTVYDVMGLIKSGGVLARLPSIMVWQKPDTANVTTVTAAYASGTCQCYFMGVSPQTSSSANILVNVTTALATITWAEVAVYKGTPRLNNTCTDLTRLGYADVSGAFNSTGIKNVTVSFTTNAQPGDNLWVLIGAAATTMCVFRGGIADNLQSGIFQTLAQRPSLWAGPGATTLMAAATVPTWVVCQVN